MTGLTYIWLISLLFTFGVTWIVATHVAYDRGRRDAEREARRWNEKLNRDA